MKPGFYIAVFDGEFQAVDRTLNNSFRTLDQAKKYIKGLLPMLGDIKEPHISVYSVFNRADGGWNFDEQYFI